METIEEYRQRVIATGDERKEFVMDVDGFIYWWPEGTTHGHIASHHLRWLADELDRRNEPCRKRVAGYFKANAEISENEDDEPTETKTTKEISFSDFVRCLTVSLSRLGNHLPSKDLALISESVLHASGGEVWVARKEGRGNAWEKEDNKKS